MIQDILRLLTAERDKIQKAIDALGDIAPKRRGRKPGKKAVVDDPPEWVTGKPAKKKRKMSAAARKRIGEATRARWAALRASKKK